jgi:hypothetical protein
VNIQAPLVSNDQSSELAEPGERALYNPSVPAQPLATLNTTAGYTRCNTSLPQSSSAPIKVVSFISVELDWPFPASSAKEPSLLYGLDSVDQISKSIAVVDVGSRADYREWNSLPIYDDVALRAWFSFICRIRASAFAPFLARTVAESTAARDQSILPASPSLSNRTWCSFSHTPASCQSRNLRQQVMPLPQPISGGSIFHWIPDLSTKRIPVSAARSGTRGRPPLALTCWVGSNGSMSCHNASVTTRGFICPFYPSMGFETIPKDRFSLCRQEIS